MEIKVIDLLNKIANGEEDDLLTEFEFDKRVWNFKGLNYSEFCLDGWLLNQNITITKHKEILEEPEKTEKLEKPTQDEYLYSNGKELYENDMKVYDKINELIDEINNLKEK